MNKIYCRSCGKRIVFLKTDSGKKIPINYETLSNEDIENLEQGEEVLFDSTLHISHFSDCPQSKKWRKK